MFFDSSIWIDFLNGKQTSHAALLQNRIKSYSTVYVCPPIYQEVLQGIRDDKKLEEIRDLILSLNFLTLDSYFASDGAISIYRLLRKKGITIEKPNDCLIAFYAIHFKLELVHNDKDFDKIAKHTSLKVYSA